MHEAYQLLSQEEGMIKCGMTESRYTYTNHLPKIIQQPFRIPLLRLRLAMTSHDSRLTIHDSPLPTNGNDTENSDPLFNLLFTDMIPWCCLMISDEI